MSQPFYCYFQALGLHWAVQNEPRTEGKIITVTGHRESRRRGVLITLEGIEGSGKTTQFTRLATFLREEGHNVVETREPGGTPLAEQIRALILSSTSEPMVPRCEALLILASRSQHIAQVIEPALRKSAVVLCDRFIDSTLAYQGYARGLDLAVLRSMNRFAAQGIDPGLTILLNVPVPTGLARRGQHPNVRDRLDLEAARFHAKVHKGYLALAARNPGRIKVVDGRPDPDTVADKVAVLARRFLLRRGLKVHRLKS